ncbi:MAG: replication-associated recombination protein A [Desulfobacterales bacterium]|nr:replication-associated recombination protein A [Desulfobacterales bacterium]MDJ0874033.1 replication-associated recombination protein A [Desulfobacterales bacterium]
MDLFEHSARQKLDKPLADRMRPQRLEDFVGQSQAVGEGSLIRQVLGTDRLFSLILWGPPGTGKTTLARLVAGAKQAHFIEFSAVLSGVKDIRRVIEEARQQRDFHHRRTILFVDEIHRFNKAQQDAFLHHVENGLITLIGATTENPSFEVIPALMSRCRVVLLKSHTDEDLKNILSQALTDRERGLGRQGQTITPEALDFLVRSADGDARRALNSLEVAASLCAAAGRESSGPCAPIDLPMLEAAFQKKALRYDKSGEEHFNLISALHKSLRGSDADAALYWLARMLAAGEDPLYIARRMVRFACEDIGLADPQALTTALNAMEAFRFLGRPEGELALAQAALYLATAPKSNSIYRAWRTAARSAEDHGSLPVPLHIRNAPTSLMKNLGYGRGYRYAHDYKDAFIPQDYFPDQLKGTIFFEPSDRGYEKEIKRRLDRWRPLTGKKAPREP